MLQALSTAHGVHNGAVSLNQLVRNLVEEALPAAILHRTRIVNDVQKNLLLGAGAQELAEVLEELLDAVIMNSKEGDIHISAERFKDMVTLQIDERNNYNGYALSFSVGSLGADAARFGGYISIEGATKRQTRISFSFPTQFAA